MTEEIRAAIRAQEEGSLREAENSRLWGSALLAAAYEGTLQTHSVICGGREFLLMKEAGKIGTDAEGYCTKITTGKRVWLYSPETGSGAEVIEWN